MVITTTTIPKESITTTNVSSTVEVGAWGITIKVPQSNKYKVSGYFPKEDVYIREVIYSNPATIVFWSDETKTVAKCHAEDTYNEETGLMLCILKKLIGSTSINKILEDWVPEQLSFNSQRVTLAELLKKYNR